MLSNIDLGGLGLETASTSVLGIGSLESEVAILTPGAIPGVLYEPVFGTVFFAHTNEENTVVKVDTARGLSDDTSLVKLELSTGSINSNRDGSLGKESLKLSWVVGRNVRVGSSLNNTVNGKLAATERPSSVRVIRLKIDSGILGIIKSAVHKTTHATEVTVGLGAVNKLLFRKRDKITGSNLVGSFEGSSGGERPAGTTSSLVLNISDSSSFNPVNGHVAIVREKVLNARGNVVLSVVTLHKIEFVAGHGSEFVKSHGESIFIGMLDVVVEDLSVVLLEYVKSEEVLVS